MKNLKIFYIFIMLSLMILIGFNAGATTMEEVQATITENTQALNELMQNPSESMPFDLLNAASCVASVHLVKAGFIWGARMGHGIVSCRTSEMKWTNPLFIDLGSASWGFQIGVEVVDLILVFTNKNAQESFEKGNFTLDAAGGLAVGPKGRELSAGTNYKITDMTYSYSKTQGLYLGVSLEGSYLRPDKEYNEVIYGTQSPKEIFSYSSNKPSVVLPFISVLLKYSH